MSTTEAVYGPPCTQSNPCGACDFCCAEENYPHLVGPLAGYRSASEVEGEEAAEALYGEFRGRWLTTTQIGELPPPEYLVGDYLMRDSLALLYGMSGTYKTFLALDLVLHLATGSWWHGHVIDRPGKVLYVIAEGARGIGRRIEAWKEHAKVYDLDRDSFEPIHWYPQALNLRDMVNTSLLERMARELRPDLIVFDTYARCTTGVEENSAKETGLIVEALDRLRRASEGACVLMVHHTGKDSTNGARGSSALKAAVDTEIEVSANDQRITVKVSKQKDGPEAPTVQLAPRPLVDSLVLVPAELVAATAGLSPSAGVALRHLEAIEKAHLPGGVANGVWKTTCGDDIKDRTFYRSVGDLVAAGVVRNVSTSTVPRYLTASTADRLADMAVNEDDR